jgi:hypothetical protein
MVAFVMLLQAIILTIWTIVDPSLVRSLVNTRVSPAVEQQSCGSNSSWGYAVGGSWIGIIMAAGCVLSYKMRR